MQHLANMVQGYVSMLTPPSDYAISYDFCYTHDPETDCHYVIISRCCPRERYEASIDRSEERRMRAQVHWAKLKGYLVLCRIFRQTMREEDREPHFYELIGYLQLPGFNWRRPTAPQMHQLRRFELGLDDPRLCNMELYFNTRWLARQMLSSHPSHAR